MELQLLKQLKKHILRGLTQLSLTKFNVLIQQSKQLSKLKKPICLFSAQIALEVLFSVSGTQLYQKMQQFESLTFQFEFKKERIFKAKKHLLNYLSEKQQNEVIQESLAQSIINYVALIENIVAFAEVHYLSIKNFSNLMQNEMNKNQLKHQDIQSINEHLSKVTKIQKEIKETVLQLPLEEIKNSQYQPTNLLNEESQYNEQESQNKESFTNEQPNVEQQIFQKQQQSAKLMTKQSDQIEHQQNSSATNSQNASQIILESQEPINEIELLKNSNFQQINQQQKEPVQLDQQEQKELQHQKENKETINLAVETIIQNADDDDDIQKDQPQENISLINSNSEKENEVILGVDQDNQPQVQDSLIYGNNSDQQIIQDILLSSPLESLDTLPKNRFVQSSLSQNKVSIKMAVLQNLVNESLFIKQKPEVDCFKEKLEQNGIQDLIQRPVRQVRSRAAQPFNQDQQPLKKSLFDIQ